MTVVIVAFTCLLAVLSFVSPAHAQQEKIDSKVLGEERVIEIRLPDGYQGSGERYHVLYVLDADSGLRFDRAVEDVATAAKAGTSPGMIVVGIRNTIRNRDMIPAVVPDRPESGGGPKFLQFIGEELIPHIDERYRTNSNNLLFGGSNAGLFTVFAMLERPDLFVAAIAGSPMIGHCPDYMYRVAANLDDPVGFEGRYLYMIYGDDDYNRCTDYVADFASYLQSKEAPGFDIVLIVVEDGGHVPTGSVARGLEYVFSRDR